MRPLTRGEVQALFDHADDKVARARRLGRKGWVAAFRDATLFKAIYAFGLRRREAAMLDLADFSRNAEAAEFGRFGACHVRYGKAMRGSPPRRRTVLTVMAWSAEVLAEYVETVRPLYDAGPPMWPTERGGRIRTGYVDDRFAQYRTELGLPPELNPHGLRHSYVTHLIEDGWDPRFVQLQVGHAVASYDRDLHRRVVRLPQHACCAGRWTRRSSHRAKGPADGQDDRLPLAPAPADGQGGHVLHHRPGPAPGRTRDRAVRRPRSTGWSPAPRNG